MQDITFGVEIETTIPSNAPVCVGGYHCGTPVTSGPQFNGASWKAERDGSIAYSCGRQPCEFVSPVLKGEEGVQHLLSFLAWLKQIGAKVNASCGFHIHVGVNTLPVNPNFRGGEKAAAREILLNTLARTVSRHTRALYAQTGTLSRERGHFCAPASTDYRQAVNNASRKRKANHLPHNRYHLLNLTTVQTRGTVEFRCFAGTLNPNKVLMHLWSVLALCEQAAQSKYLGDWAKDEPGLSGEVALQRLVNKVLDSERALPTLRERKRRILSEGKKMAQQYDRARGIVAPVDPRDDAIPPQHNYPLDQIFSTDERAAQMLNPVQLAAAAQESAALNHQQ